MHLYAYGMQGSEGYSISLLSQEFICMLMESQGSEGERYAVIGNKFICMLMESQGSEGWFLN